MTNPLDKVPFDINSLIPYTEFNWDTVQGMDRIQKDIGQMQGRIASGIAKKIGKVQNTVSNLQNTIATQLASNVKQPIETLAQIHQTVSTSINAKVANINKVAAPFACLPGFTFANGVCVPTVLKTGGTTTGGTITGGTTTGGTIGTTGTGTSSSPCDNQQNIDLSDPALIQMVYALDASDAILNDGGWFTNPTTGQRIVSDYTAQTWRTAICNPGCFWTVFPTPFSVASFPFLYADPEAATQSLNTIYWNVNSNSSSSDNCEFLGPPELGYTRGSVSSNLDPQTLLTDWIAKYSQNAWNQLNQLCCSTTTGGTTSGGGTMGGGTGGAGGLQGVCPDGSIPVNGVCPPPVVVVNPPPVCPVPPVCPPPVSCEPDEPVVQPCPPPVINIPPCPPPVVIVNPVVGGTGTVIGGQGGNGGTGGTGGTGGKGGTGGTGGTGGSSNGNGGGSLPIDWSNLCACLSNALAPLIAAIGQGNTILEDNGGGSDIEYITTLSDDSTIENWITEQNINSLTGLDFNTIGDVQTFLQQNGANDNNQIQIEVDD